MQIQNTKLYSPDLRPAQRQHIAHAFLSRAVVIQHFRHRTGRDQHDSRVVHAHVHGLDIFVHRSPVHVGAVGKRTQPHRVLLPVLCGQRGKDVHPAQHEGNGTMVEGPAVAANDVARRAVGVRGVVGEHGGVVQQLRSDPWQTTRRRSHRRFHHRRTGRGCKQSRVLGLGGFGQRMHAVLGHVGRHRGEAGPT